MNSIQKEKLSIIITTRSRTLVFAHTIRDVMQQVVFVNCKYQVVVVNNNQNSSSIYKYVKELCEEYPEVTHVYESSVGLSTARNTGIKQCNGVWVLFLDDDIQLPPGFFDPLKRVIDTNRFDCFGGYYLPFYPEGKPKWLSPNFGVKSLIKDTTGSIDVLRDGFLSAGILCMKKNILTEVGGFSNRLGMNSSIGYGEEDDLQIRLQNAGYTIGFIADWWLYHAVLSHKHQVKWHLKSAFARGRDGQRVHSKWNQWDALYRLVKGSGGVIYRLFKHGVWLATNQEYYWQNFTVDVFGSFFNICGRFYSVFRY